MSLGSADLPSLTGYRELFALCAAAGVAAAIAALAIQRRGAASETTA